MSALRNIEESRFGDSEMNGSVKKRDTTIISPKRLPYTNNKKIQLSVLIPTLFDYKGNAFISSMY